MKNNNILVTGGGGFIGSHLVDSLKVENEVTVVDNLSDVEYNWLPEDITFHNIDIRNREKIEQIIESHDIVFHLAADAHTRENTAGWDNPYKNIEINAMGTQNVFEAARSSRSDPTVVYASSCAIYGEPKYTPIDEDHPINPISPYGVHKLVGDRYVHAYHSEHDMRTMAIRIFNTYGPRQPRYVMYDFLKKLQKNNTTLEVLGTGQQIRDYTYVADAVHAFKSVATSGAAGEAYNLSGDQIISIRELAEKIIDMLGTDTKIKYTGETWKGDPTRLEADIEKLRGIGYEPTYCIDEGLEQFIEWFRKTEGQIIDER